ncbi:MAG: bifunctional nuclease family protein [Deltaproteobacteria bacterium]|nr:bifunctional nuclease family protein [Deltaproteobacteria bacterium]
MAESKKTVAVPELVEMKVTGLTIDPFTNMPIIILKDLEEKSALPIWIGLIEASAIATELEKIQLSRPMTHDLIKNLLGALGVTVNKVEVNDLSDNTFYARITLTHAGKELTLDSRPSDAIAIALRTKAPIFVDKKVMEKSRKIDVTKEGKGGEEKMKKEKWNEILENLSLEDFGKYKM